MEILNTKDYDRFDTITGNRNISQPKVDGIINDIKNGLNLLPYCPIIVYDNEGKLNIIDGQHRFTVSKKMGVPVYYVVAEKISLQHIAKINSKQDKWKAMDFVKCFIKVGIKDYETLLSVVTKYKIGISTALDMLMKNRVNNGGSKVSELFRNGEFKVNFYDETIKTLDLNHKLFDRYTFYNDRKLIGATRQIMDKGLCDFDVLLEKIKKYPVLMDKQVSVKDYIYNIEKVYNHNNQKRQVII